MSAYIATIFLVFYSLFTVLPVLAQKVEVSVESGQTLENKSSIFKITKITEEIKNPNLYQLDESEKEKLVKTGEPVTKTIDKSLSISSHFPVELVFLSQTSTYGIDSINSAIVLLTESELFLNEQKSSDLIRLITYSYFFLFLGGIIFGILPLTTNDLSKQTKALVIGFKILIVILSFSTQVNIFFLTWADGMLMFIHLFIMLAGATIGIIVSCGVSKKQRERLLVIQKNTPKNLLNTT